MDDVVVDDFVVDNIVVDDVLIVREPVLRSGRLMANKESVLYKIRKGDSRQTVTQLDLKFMKRVLGADSIIYSTAFSDPQKEKYIV